MDYNWNAVLTVIRTINQILTAGVSITAFSLLLYALSFNLKDRVARSFALIMFCVVIVFSTEAIGSTMAMIDMDIWLRLEWIGIILLPAAYLHFSDALLVTTGNINRLRRRGLVPLAYGAAAVFILCLPFPWFFSTVLDNRPAPYFRATPAATLYTFYYIIAFLLSVYYFLKAYRRTVTPTSRRRMTYLIVGAIAPALGSFPYMLLGSTFAGRHPFVFWVISVISVMLVGVMIVVMAYSIAFFGVSWSDRVVKSRLFKWILRGPATASLTLAISTIVRRLGEQFGVTYSAFVPITVVVTVLVCQHLITLFAPALERMMFRGNDRTDIDLLHILEDRLLTSNDLRQFLEFILSAVCDRFQAVGAYIVALNEGDLEMVITIGNANFERYQSADLLKLAVEEKSMVLLQWGDDVLLPLVFKSEINGAELLGFLGISRQMTPVLDADQQHDLTILAQRAVVAMHDRRVQQETFKKLQVLTPEMGMIQRLRASGPYDKSTLYKDDLTLMPDDMSLWVKEALTHYWGGPKLTDSPLLQLRVVQEAVEKFEGNQIHALRAILHEAIDRIRPDGERRFTAEWILYNILEMRFLEGRKVREIATRLAMSEADLYRKQRIAVEAVVNGLIEMETQARYQL